MRDRGKVEEYHNRIFGSQQLPKFSWNRNNQISVLKCLPKTFPLSGIISLQKAVVESQHDLSERKLPDQKKLLGHLAARPVWITDLPISLNVGWSSCSCWKSVFKIKKKKKIALLLKFTSSSHYSRVRKWLTTCHDCYIFETTICQCSVFSSSIFEFPLQPKKLEVLFENRVSQATNFAGSIPQLINQSGRRRTKPQQTVVDSFVRVHGISLLYHQSGSLSLTSLWRCIFG